MKPWLAIVGIGEDGLDGLGARARALIDGAEVLIGGARHLAMVRDDGRERMTWPSPLAALIDAILAHRGKPVCVLATGDPLHYGIGVTLLRHVPRDEITVIPAPSAFALACARLGWPRAETETVTLHGRPVSLIEPCIQPGARLLVLSDDASTPAALAQRLVARGYGQSRLTVLEHMGGSAECRTDGTAAEWKACDIADFNTVAVECVADSNAAPLPRVPGLPDDAYRHDGQITKREVRAATLAALAPGPGQLLWDVGAGSGAIGIEWMRAHTTCRTIAVERNAGRAAVIADNADALGVPRLLVVRGEAPAALADLEPPNAVFVGGGLAQQGLMAACWDALPPGGRLVANAVTFEGERALLVWREAVGGELTRIEVSRAGSIGRRAGWKPMRPVTSLAAVKR